MRITKHPTYKKLTFSITDSPILKGELDHETQTFTPTYVDDKGLKPILKPSELTYKGIERRIGYLRQTPSPLPELLHLIETKGTCIPSQRNLVITPERGE